jgi:ABC-type molybdate transport system substrate-binding protein
MRSQTTTLPSAIILAVRYVARIVFYASALCVTTVAVGTEPLTQLAPKQNAITFPPWQKGQNNDVIHRGLEFTVPQVDVLADFHGDLTDPKLVLFVGGNYFFAMAPLVKEFEREHPEYAGRIYWETIPPGLLVTQMKAGGVVTSGNMTWTVKPDAYFAGLQKVKDLIKEGLLVGPPIPYVTNQLTIMVARGNPGQIATLNDLGKKEARLAMPNPEFEGVTRQIKASLIKAGGSALEESVYNSKVKAGTTILTHIHHRQTPLFLMQGAADAGITWKSEATFQEQVGNAISHVDIPDEVNTTAIYAGALVSGAAHVAAANAWLTFIRSPASIKIFEGYGFKRYQPDEPK